MNTTFITYGIDVVSEPDLGVLTGTGQDGAGQVTLQGGTRIFADGQIVEVIVEQVEVNGELTGATRITGINIYASKADFDAGVVLYAYEPATAGDYAPVQETVAGMGDGYLQFDASVLLSSDAGAPVLGALFIAPGTDANDGYGTLTLDHHSDTDLDGDGMIAAGSAEAGNGAFNTKYPDAAYAPPLAGDHVVEGGEGDDYIDPFYSADPEGDHVDTGDAADGSNDDVIRAGGGADTVLAGDGDDYVDGGSGNDQLDGGDGDDTLLGGTGDDRLYGGIGNDSAMGGDGADSFEAYDGNDYFNGGDGDDWMNGDKGDDTLYGGAGNDWMRASFGNDFMVGGTGDDYIWSGYGDDTIVLENDFGNDTIEMEDQDEVYGDILDLTRITDDLRIDFTDINMGVGTISDGKSTARFEAVEHLILGSGTNTLVLADLGGADKVEGFVAPTQNADGSYSGHDLLDVSGLTDDDGNPIDVNDVVVFDDGTGSAVLRFPHGEALLLTGVAPADVSGVAQLAAMGIPAPKLDGVVEGGAGSDLIDDGFTGDPDGDRVDGGDAIDPGAGADDDSIRAGSGNDTIRAGLGNDTIDAEFGDDSLEGGAGDDLLIGGLGEDMMQGGAGNDSFQVSSGDTAFGGDGDDSFFVDDSLRDGAGFKIDGGATGETKGDTLYVNGPADISYDPDDPESGSVQWLDGSVLSFSDIENVVYVPCFTESSMIKTLGGEKPARDIRPGDLVLTRDDGLQPVRWAGTRELSAGELAANPALRPVRIREGALGPGMPCRDLIVSPQHRMLISGPRTELWFGSEEVFVAAIHLTCLDGVDQLGNEAVTYVHFMFEKHQLVQGDGAWSESFQPGDLSLLGMDEDQRDEIVGLFPQLMHESADTVYPAARQTLTARETRVLFA